MKRLLVSIIVFAASTLTFAASEQPLPHKPCEDLKAEITAKIDANGVRSYTLEIVLNAEVGDQTVVGSCDGGTKKIVYARK